MNILKIIRLDKKISTGLVFKVLLPTAPGEKEHDPLGYVDEEGNIYDKLTGKCIHHRD